MKITHQSCLWLAFLAGLVGSIGSFFAQYVLHLNPCPMCIFQRVATIGVAVFALPFLWSAIQRTWLRIVVALWVAIPALFGLLVAIQQIRLQSLPPDEVPACGPGLSFLVDTLPLTEVVSIVLSGTGECAAIERILGIPLPIWSSVLFSTILLILLVSLFTKHNTKAA